MVCSNEDDERAAYTPPAEPRFIGTARDVANTDDSNEPLGLDGSFNYASG